VLEKARELSRVIFAIINQGKFQKDFSLKDQSLTESTKDRRPLKLIYYGACLSQDDAIYLKSYHGKMFIRKSSNLV